MAEDGKKTRNSTGAGRKRKTSIDREVELDTVLSSIWRFISTGMIGKILASILIFFLLIGLNMIFSGNNLNVFLILIGVETLVWLLGLWLVTLIYNYSRMHSDNKNGN